MVEKQLCQGDGSNDNYQNKPISESNAVTKNVHGVLNQEGVNIYFAAGLSIDDISAANILSRKGVYTITEILDKVVAGDAWENIISDIERNGTPQRNIRSAVSRSISSDEVKLRMESNGPLEILTCISAAEITGEPIERFLEKSGKATEIVAMLNEHLRQIDNQVYAELLADGIAKRNIEDSEVIAPLKQQAINNGMTDAEVETQLDAGYDILDIVNASAEHAATQESVEPILRRQRSNLSTKKEVEAQ